MWGWLPVQRAASNHCTLDDVHSVAAKEFVCAYDQLLEVKSRLHTLEGRVASEDEYKTAVDAENQEVHIAEDATPAAVVDIQQLAEAP